MLEQKRVVIGDRSSLKERKREEKIEVESKKGIGEKKEKTEEKNVIAPIGEAIDNGVTNINPDIFYSNLVSNYERARKLYGKRLLRLITGYDPKSIEINLQLKEFREELKNSIYRNVKRLQEEGVLDKQYGITAKTARLIASQLLEEELEKLARIAREGIQGKKPGYGEEKDLIMYKPGIPYRSLSSRATIKTTARRMHRAIHIEDLRYKERKEQKGLELVIVLDTSASMKGEKIRNAKKAGIALTHIAINDGNKVGLVLFSSTSRKKIKPTKNEQEIVESIVRIHPMGQTNMQEAIRDSISLFHRGKTSKHIILITDALPNVGEKPLEQVLRAINTARERGISISIIGIMLNKEGIRTAEIIARNGAGRFYDLRDANKLDIVLIRDYEEHR